MFIRCATLTALLLLFLSTFSGARQNDILTFEGHNCVAGHVLVKFQSAMNTPQAGITERQRLMSRFNAKLSRRFQSGFELWIVDPSSTFKVMQSLKQESIIEYVEPDFIYTSEITAHKSICQSG